MCSLVGQPGKDRVIQPVAQIKSYFDLVIQARSQTSCRGAYATCRNLTNISLPNLQEENIRVKDSAGNRECSPYPSYVGDDRVNHFFNKLKRDFLGPRQGFLGSGIVDTGYYIHLELYGKRGVVHIDSLKHRVFAAGCHFESKFRSRSIEAKMPSHKTFIIKKKLAKKMRQNRPIPHWIRMRTDNTIRYNAKRRHWRRTKLGF
ncbi:hypothetical protein EZV62_013596 [Acer yangbiense]|uniref:Ribosomal protein L39e n=1 Tax=Acer yangbiense TaxID=1000413 RepID=A0A5C7HYJ7_9ROSI|nr:hypothetical protein EZV62_013596 [Acer yangbiense]